MCVLFWEVITVTKDPTVANCENEQHSRKKSSTQKLLLTETMKKLDPLSLIISFM